MQSFHVTISNNGRVVIPAVVRKKLKIKEGDELVLSVSGKDDIRIQTVRHSVSKLQEMFSDVEESLSEELIKARRKEKG